MLLALFLAARISSSGDVDAARRPLIAVLEFRTKLGDAEKADSDPSYFSDVVRSQALDELPNARIMTRENMTVLMQAGGKNLADCVGECDVDTGRNLGADEVITGELLKVGTSFKLDLKLHSTADGQLLAGAQASGKTVDELDEAMKATVTKLLTPLKAKGMQPAVMAPAPPPAAARPNPSQPYKLIRVVDGRIVHVMAYFNVGERSVKAGAMPMLREIATALLGPPTRPATVVCRGDVDTQVARRNALQRAWALRHALVEYGVSPASVQTLSTDTAGQARAVKQVKNPYVCEIVLR